MLLLYLRIFSDSGNRAFRRTCWAVIVFCTIYYFATVIEDLLQTTPLSYFWLVRTYDSWNDIHHARLSLTFMAALSRSLSAPYLDIHSTC
jgi:hypothetical protein